MNGSERIMGIPYGITFHPSWWHKNAGVSFSKDFFENPVYRVEADVEMRKVLYDRFGLGEKDPKPRPILGSDLIASGYLLSGMLSCGIEFADGLPPVIKGGTFTYDKLDSLAKITLENSELWQNTEDQIKYLTLKYGYVLPCVDLMGVQNVAMDLRGEELFFDYYDAEDNVDRLLEIITRLMAATGKRFKMLHSNISSGVTSIVHQTVPDVFLTSNCTVDMISADMYENILLKYDIKLAESFNSFGVHHCGQSTQRHIKAYAKIPNLTFVEAGYGSDLDAVVNALPENVAINARYGPVRLQTVKKEDLEHDLKDIYSKIKNRICSISCVGIDGDIEDARVADFLSICSGLQ